MNVISYHQLHLLITDIETQQANHPSFGLFNAAKINNLFQKNRIRIQTLQDFLAKNVRDFAKKDDNGKAVISTVEGRQELTFENELDKKAYLDAYEAFATKTFELNI
jgi:hypothetical protein